MKDVRRLCNQRMKLLKYASKKIIQLCNIVKSYTKYNLIITMFLLFAMLHHTKTCQ